MSVELIRRKVRGARGGDSRRTKRVVEFTLEHEGAADREVTLVLTDNAEIQTLNRDFRGKDKPTDVLAFGYDQPVGPLGDVIISIETAIAQAASRRVDLDREIELLAVHGTLHLLGHDHGEPEEARIMRNRTRLIRRKFNSTR